MDAHFQRLLGELGARAGAELDQVSAAAQARADSIRVESAARIEKRREAAIAQCDEDVQRSRNSALAAARHEGRRRLLDTQHALVERVVSAAVEATNRKLSLCVNPDRLSRRAGELLSYAGNGPAELRCRTPIAEQIAARLRPRGANVVADDDAAWGLTLVADDGRLTIDDTVDAWLEAERAAIAITVCRRIEEHS
jgi:vacuolar-type H+-ATPase subunit E/Vma4